MATPLNVLSALTASQGLSGSSAAFASLTVNGVAVTGGGGGSGTVNNGDQYKLAYYSSSGTTVDDATGLLWDGSAFTVSGSTLTSGSVVVSGGDLRLNNNVIKASDGNASITLNSTSAKVEGDLTVGSGHFKVGNNVESLIADVATGYIAAQYGFAVTGSTTTSGSLTVGGNAALTANNGATVNGSTLTANAGLVVNNSALLVDGGGISGSSTLQVGGVATFANNVTIAGDLTVNGTKTVVNTTDLFVTDKKVVIASGSTTAANATTAGLYLGNDSAPVASFQYISSSSGAHKWTSSEHLNISGTNKSLYLSDNMALARTTFVADQTDVNVLLNSSDNGVTINGKTAVGKLGATLASSLGLPAFTGAAMSGSATVALVAPAIVLSGSTLTTVSNALTVQGTTTLAAATVTTLTASTGVSGTLGNFATLNMQGLQVATRTGVQTVYNTYRHTVSGTLNGSGAAEVNLTSVSATGFDYLDLHKIAVDVMIDDGTGLAYTNDLASVKLENSASQVYVKIDAPATPNRGYRLVAVNEGDLTF